MIKFIFSLLTIYTLTITEIFGQIVIIDKITRKPISDVLVLSGEGSLLDVSDENGQLSLIKLKTLIKDTNKKISFNHFSYKEILFNSLDEIEGSIISLEPDLRFLNDLIVKPNKKPNYISINGYYRSYQLHNGLIEYYSDGDVSILCPIKNRKSVLNKRISERSFGQKLKTSIIKEGKNNTIVIKTIGPPLPTGKIDLQEIEKTLPKKEIQGNLLTFLDNMGDKKIQIELKPISNQVAVEKYIFSEKNPNVITGFGLENIIDFEQESFVFQGNSFEDVNLSKLTYMRTIKRIKSSSKKKEGFEKFESVKEIFVTDIEYVNTEKKGYSKWSGVKEISNYSNPFWANIIGHPLFKPLPSVISESIKGTLVEYHNGLSTK